MRLTSRLPRNANGTLDLVALKASAPRLHQGRDRVLRETEGPGESPTPHALRIQASIAYLK